MALQATLADNHRLGLALEFCVRRFQKRIDRTNEDLAEASKKEDA